MEFTSLTLRQTLTVKKLFSFHYFEYPKGYVFEGEQHDFWEFLYVDKGEVEVRADDRVFELSQGMMIFHKPGEFHTVRVLQHHKPPNLIVISFECRSPGMTRFADKIMNLGNRERDLLAQILQEGFHTFEPPFDDPAVHRLSPHPRAPLAGEQIMKNYLEILLVLLLRNDDSHEIPSAHKPETTQKENAEQLIVEQAVAFMIRHRTEKLSIDQICKAMHLGKSRLKEIFHARKSMGAIDYFRKLKIDEAKSLIRERHFNFTEIAAQMGYGSIHYFSRDFKRTTGMSPTEYARSVIARSGGVSAPPRPDRHV